MDQEVPNTEENGLQGTPATSSQDTYKELGQEVKKSRFKKMKEKVFGVPETGPRQAEIVYVFTRYEGPSSTQTIDSPPELLDRGDQITINARRFKQDSQYRHDSIDPKHAIYPMMAVGAGHLVSPKKVNSFDTLLSIDLIKASDTEEPPQLEKHEFILDKFNGQIFSVEREEKTGNAKATKPTPVELALLKQVTEAVINLNSQEV